MWGYPQLTADMLKLTQKVFEMKSHFFMYLGSLIEFKSNMNYDKNYGRGLFKMILFSIMNREERTK